MIYIELIGGLGNQMFIYAFARAQQMTTGEQIVICDFRGEEQRKIRESEYAIGPLIAENCVFHEFQSEKRGKGILENVLDPSRYILFRLSCKIWNVKNWHKANGPRKTYEMEKVLQPLWNKLGICSVQNGYIPVARYGWPDKFVCRGYFQSAAFWGKYKEHIREELCRPDLIRQENQALLQKIRSCESVCLHIRLGDYVRDPIIRKRHYVCDINYYRKAIKRAKEILHDPIFFVFTNENKTVQQLDLLTDEKWNLVPERNTALEDMQLMAQCKNHIISNSSFSWWGQFLSQNPQKKVFAPARWYRTDMPQDIYLKGWELIPVEPFSNCSQ